MSSRIASSPARAQASSASPPGAPDTAIAPKNRAAALDGDAAAHDGHARKVTDRGSGLARLAAPVERHRVLAKAYGGPRLVDRDLNRVRSRKAIPKEHLQDSAAINDGDTDLVTACSAVCKRALCGLQGSLRRELSCQERGLLRGRRKAADHNRQQRAYRAHKGSPSSPGEPIGDRVSLQN